MKQMLVTLQTQSEKGEHMSHGEGGKGSSRRKENVRAISDNWDKIFGGNKQKEPIMELDDDECFGSTEEHDDDNEWTCSVCGGPMYRQSHWNYGQCDDCGARQELEDDI